MGLFEQPKSFEGAPNDLLPLLRRSCILSDRQFEEVCGKVQSGEYPLDPRALSERLVEEQVLTAFQAERLLQNKFRGFVVGRYVVLDRVGEGARGRVFKAQHRLMGRIVALKIIAPRIASRANSIARFHREMRLIGRLDHPNVVRAFDADQVGDLLYIIMEYVPGRNLEHVLQDRCPLPPFEVVDYMSQAALGLGHAHDRGIVHRDVKPSNLLLSDQGQIKVLDLGLGVLMEADSQASFATAAGFAVGTVDFMSPEQASGRDIDGRSDLFSLGCTMYYLLSGRLPFPGETLLECLGRRLQGLPIPIKDYCPDLPPPLVGVLDKLLARQPEDRFQTALEAAEALQALLEDKTKIPPPLKRSTHEATRASAPKTRPVPTSATDPLPPPSPASDHLPASPSTRDLLIRFARSLLSFLFFSLLVFGVGFALGLVSTILAGF